MINKVVTREDIIHKLDETLEPLDFVHAFWEGGAAAFNRIDKWSDIDLYLVVDDGKINETFSTVEKALKSLSPIAQKLETPQLPWPGVSQTFYKLENTSEYLLIDLAVLNVNSPEKFLETKIHGAAVFYFNKSNNVKIPLLDKPAFAKKLSERLDRLKARFSMFNVLVQKEINRGNSLEAIDMYHNFTLASLIEVLRMRHYPVHYDFRMRYVHYELPARVILKLEQLYFVCGEKDLQRKYQEAAKWFLETASDIERRGVERVRP